MTPRHWLWWCMAALVALAWSEVWQPEPFLFVRYLLRAIQFPL